MYIKLSILILALFFGLNINSQSKKTFNFYSFEEVERLHVKKPLPIVIITYTDWCEICHAMLSNMNKLEEKKEMLNKNFYFIKLNAEAQKDIFFLGKTFTYKPNGHETGLHELAKELAFINHKISYPTTTLLNTNFEITFQIPGYVSPEKLSSILKEYLKTF